MFLPWGYAMMAWVKTVTTFKNKILIIKIVRGRVRRGRGGGGGSGAGNREGGGGGRRR
jgi:hypothetical protein